jgi:hypothetical protein
VPVLTSAQINRSAREFASEQIQEYVTTKLFKTHSYKSISLGQLKEFKDKKNIEIAWTIEHKFEITPPHDSFNQKATTPKEYKFLFFLDDKMRVIRADSYFTQ